MIYLTSSQEKSLIKIFYRWNDFKKRRNAEEFEIEMGDGFITIRERERMMDKIERILFKGKML